MTKLIEIAIADDHRLLRLGIISLLQKMEGVSIIGEMSTGEEAVNFAALRHPDVFLIDIVLTGMTGIEATRWIKEQSPHVKIILISSEVNKDFISDGIKSGIDGYLNKNIGQDTLFDAIRTVLKGERYFSPEITAFVFNDFYSKEKVRKDLAVKKKTILSKREEEVLVQIALGKSPKEIAHELFISIKTVDTHKTHIKEKLNLSNTALLVKYAIKSKLVEM